MNLRLVRSILEFGLRTGKLLYIMKHYTHMKNNRIGLTWALGKKDFFVYQVTQATLVYLLLLLKYMSCLVLSCTKILSNCYNETISFIEGCLPSKVVFHQRSSSIEGHFLSKVVFHQRLSSFKGYLQYKVFFNLRSHFGFELPLSYPRSESSKMSLVV